MGTVLVFEVGEASEAFRDWRETNLPKVAFITGW